MKKLVFVSVVVALLATQNLLAQEAPFYHRPAPAAGSTLSTGQSGTGGNIDVIYHKIFWRINPDSTKYIKGSVQTNFKTLQSSVSTITMDLNSVLVIDSVIFRNARLAAGNITRSGNVVSINLGTAVPNSFIDSFTIYYQGVPPAVSGAAQGYQRSSATGVGNFITTLSESYEDRDWWPCKADMQDKIDSMDITVSVPWASPTAADTFWVACNGKLIDSTISGSSRTFVFSNRYPMASYLVAVCVAKFNRYYRSTSSNGTVVPVVYNLFRGKASYTNILTAMDNMNPLVTALSQRFGDYPFKNEKHGFYDGLLGASGMEHQTFSGIASGSLASNRTLAHELVHQWFGDNVTFATWNDLWLAEGFARYGEALAGELVPATGINPYTTRNSFKTSALNLGSQSAWIPNANIATSNLIWNSNYGSTVYERGAMIVSMLRSICGDAKFYEALTKYQTSLAGKSATTDSLKNYFSEVLGIDLRPFFDDYVGGSGNATSAVGGVGNPINTVNWNSPSANKLVVQMGGQSRSVSANVSYFRGPVVLHVTGAVAGQDTTITFFDWGSGNLSYAGNGVSIPVTGNRLSYYLSFTPTNVVYDDSARTLSTGSAVNAPTLDGYIWYGTSNTAWNTSGNWRSSEVPPSGADITIATTGSNQPILPGNIEVGPLNILAGNTIIMNGNTLTLNNTVRGTGTFTGSPTSSMIVNGSAGTLYFNQSSANNRSLNNFTLNNRSSAALGSALLNVYGNLTATGTNLDVRTAAVSLID